MKEDGNCIAYRAENVVFAVGGPGGLYQNAVFPEGHLGAIGLALLEGATAQNLPELQFGLASIDYRWNVSGSFMQVIPRFISTKSDGCTDEREFLREYFASAGEMCSLTFLKGYQWPFDAQRVVGGSSLIDVLVYRETVVKGRRVYLDFRRNATDFSLDELSEEARGYLMMSGALQETPYARLQHMNPEAINVYRSHGIDIAEQPLEIAVCAQHNNGGLASDIWSESVNVTHLFPAGEVNGSHGVRRPGGSALNAGQVAGFRIAEYIASCSRRRTLDEHIADGALVKSAAEVLGWIDKCRSARTSWQDERQEFQERMSRAGGLIRSEPELAKAVGEAWTQWKRLRDSGCRYHDFADLVQALCNRHLCFAHVAYLEAMLFALRSGVGSRGSAMVLDRSGDAIHQMLGRNWCAAPENELFREKVLQTSFDGESMIRTEWVPRRRIPSVDVWFETGWAQFRSGEIYNKG